MSIMTEVFNKIFKANGQGMSNYLFYKLIDYSAKSDKYLIQCINTSNTFYLSVEDIVADSEILAGLHPMQASNIGIEFGVRFKLHSQLGGVKTMAFSKTQACLVARYGKFTIRYLDRKQQICFNDSETGFDFIMDAKDIVLSEHLIVEFDAQQAFYIGFNAGLKLNSPVGVQKSREKCAPLLRLVK